MAALPYLSLRLTLHPLFINNEIISGNPFGAHLIAKNKGV